jgi:hypothetical protein
MPNGFDVCDPHMSALRSNSKPAPSKELNQQRIAFDLGATVTRTVLHRTVFDRKIRHIGGLVTLVHLVEHYASEFVASPERAFPNLEAAWALEPASAPFEQRPGR